MTCLDAQQNKLHTLRVQWRSQADVCGTHNADDFDDELQLRRQTSVW